MAVVSVPPGERARKSVNLVLQHMKDPGTAAAVAAAMGTSEATISRIKNERMEEVLTMLAHLGIKCVPSSYKCVDPESYDFLVRSHKRVMEKQPSLIWEQDE